jgi:hypothetical protein
MSTRSTWIGSVLLAGYLATWLLWRHVQLAPLAWVCAVWALVASALFAAKLGGPLRALWPNLAALLLAVSCGEAFLWMHPGAVPGMAPGTVLAGSYTRPGYFYVMPDPLVGYRPRAGVAAESIKKVGAQTVYDVTYTVGSDGLRITPPAGDEVQACVLFFGDSFAWGEGLGDQDTAPYQVGLLSKGAYRVYNFSVTGYSAHQFLSLASHEVVKKTIDCDPKRPIFALYEGMHTNIGRASGLGSWDVFGPRYLFSKTGELVYKGRFDEGEYILGDRVFVPAARARQLSKSKLYERTLGRSRSVTDLDAERFYALVGQGAKELGAQLPGLELEVLLWDDLEEGGEGSGRWTTKMHDGLRRHGLDVRSIEDIVPEYRRDLASYQIPGDGHPNAEAQRLVAAYVYDHVSSRYHARN